MPIINPLSRQDLNRWRDFLNTDSGRNGLLWLRLSGPAVKGKDAGELLQGALAFGGWQQAVDAMEKLGDKPPAPIRNDDQELET